MSTTSFLPEDYLDQRAERRTNLISLSLFGIVMVSVFAAFLVTNRQWIQVKAARTSIDQQYEEAAVQIERLNELEEQKNQMLNKARLAAALVERVPRSILLSELTSLMPPRLGLVEFELESHKIRSAAVRPKVTGTRSLRGPRRAMTREEAESLQTENKIEPPEYRVDLRVVGVAPTDVEVSRYIAELNAHKLLTDVTLEYSEEKKFEGTRMRQFEIKMKLNQDVDARDFEPTIRKKGLDDAMSNDMKIGPNASATPRGTGG